MMNKEQIEKNTTTIKNIAESLGFTSCGISKAEHLTEEAPKLETWLNQNMHGEMHYMENHFDKRLDPSLLVPGAKSVISLMYNYYPKQSIQQENSSSYHIAKYAYGEDYHFVIKRILKDFVKMIQTEIGAIDGRVFVDSAPVMERSWAQKSGLGWIGKNSLLLSKQKGSFFFLAELIIDLELIPDSPVKDYCGNCTACIDACPTDAIIAPQVVDGSKCISYFTIELKEQIPQEVKGQFKDWIFGCDICQDVCPWNRFSTPHKEEAFLPHEKLPHLSKADWEEITEDLFKEVFKKSPIKRTKIEGLKRNIYFVKQ